MNTEQLKNICDSYREAIIEDDTDRYLMLMAKDIERQTRHECVAEAYTLVDRLSNIHKDNIQEL